MAQSQIRFDDGAAYERGMGLWSRIAGEKFLDWLSHSSGTSWIDVGCGNGAFTELIVQRCAPTQVFGIDPSDGQLEFARARLDASSAVFQRGDAMALPFADHRFDFAVMALVIFFVPNPAKGVAEMVRVARPGGTVASYIWDILGGGYPFEPIQAELRSLGITPPVPPSAGASRMNALRNLWTEAGLESVETREITVSRTFTDFDDFWTSSTISGGLRPTLAAMASDDVERVKVGVRKRMRVDVAAQVTYEARANAIKGRVPDE